MPLAVVYWIGGVFGSLDYIVSGQKRRQKMSKNVISVFGCDEKEAEEIVKLNIRNHCRNVLELMKYPQITPENISTFLDFDGIEYLDQEFKKGRGVLLLTAHFGAKQALQIGLGIKGYPVNQIHYHMDREELSWIQKYISQKQRMKIEKRIPTNFISSKGFMRGAYQCLKDGQILIVAGDGIGLKSHMDKSYFPLDFLGHKMLFPTSIISLARRTGAAVLPAFAIRDEGIKHKIVIGPPIKMDAESNEDIFREFVRILEQHILRIPHLWEFWEEYEQGNLIPT